MGGGCSDRLWGGVGGWIKQCFHLAINNGVLFLYMQCERSVVQLAGVGWGGGGVETERWDSCVQHA